MMGEYDNLTVAQQEAARWQAIKAMRKRLENRKPEPALYQDAGMNRATRFIASTMQYSRAALPVIALLAAVASAIRTVQAVAEIYTAAGSWELAVWLAAFSFTVAAEGALFVLALVAEHRNLQRKLQNKLRNVWSLRSFLRAIGVRVGWQWSFESRQFVPVFPLTYFEMPERGVRLVWVMGIAFAFTVGTNLHMGLQPLYEAMAESVPEDVTISLQYLAGTIQTQPAELQVQFVVDLLAAFFPPLMALAAGHLTAGFAAEVIQGSQEMQQNLAVDMASWRDEWANPLETEEGEQLLEEILEQKAQTKAKRQASKAQSAARPTQTAHPQYQPADVPNGNGVGGGR